MGIRAKTICRVAAATSVLVITLAAAACGGADPTPPPTPKPGGTYTFPLGSSDGAEPVSIDPLNAFGEGQQVAHQIFQGLVRYEEQADGSLLAVPDIAGGWTANADATVWTFKLRHGVTFQPPVSREVTAQDFVDSWDYVTTKQSGPVYVLAPIKGTNGWGWAKKGLTGVTALSRYTLRVKLKYPFAEFAQVLGMPVAAVWPVDYLKKIGQQRFQSKPVGTGPYMVDAWRHGESIDLVRNPDYWDAARAGYVDRIHMPIIATSAEQWREFQRGAIDTIALGPPGAPSVATVEEDPNLKSGAWMVSRSPHLVVQYVGLNQRSPALAGDAGLPLRRALTQSIDAAEIIGQLQGIAVPATGFVPQGVAGAALTDLAYPYDEEKARELAASRPRVVLRFLFKPGRGYEPIVSALTAAWGRAGIHVVAKGYEFGTLDEKLRAGKDDDVFIIGWIYDYPSADSFLWLFQRRLSRALSYTGYSSRRFDDLLSQARATTDAQARQWLYAQAEQLLFEDAVVIPLWFEREYRVSDSRVQGQTADPMGMVDMWKLWVQ